MLTSALPTVGVYFAAGFQHMARGLLSSRMDSVVLTACDASKVGQPVIPDDLVVVMNHVALRDGAVRLLPDKVRPESPVAPPPVSKHLDADSSILVSVLRSNRTLIPKHSTPQRSALFRARLWRGWESAAALLPNTMKTLVEFRLVLRCPLVTALRHLDLMYPKGRVHRDGAQGPGAGRR
jgi:hypothetical protein